MPVVESLIVLASLAAGYAREKMRWSKGDASVTATLVVFTMAAVLAAFVIHNQHLFLLGLLFLSSAADPLHRGSGGYLAQHRLTTWIASALGGKKREGVGLEADLVDLVFKLLSLGIWFYGIVLVSDGLVFLLMTAIL